MTTTATTTQRPTRFNEERFCKETWCHNHWWAGDYCYYGAHYLTEQTHEEPTPPAPQTETAPVEETITVQPIRDGFYTVSLDGDKHRTFRLRTQDQDASFAPGKQIIGFLAGASNESDYVNFAFVIDGEIKLWRRFLHGYDQVIAAAKYLVSGDHQAAGRMYAQESGNCYVCNRLLTTPESIAAGIGPHCASKAA